MTQGLDTVPLPTGREFRNRFILRSLLTSLAATLGIGLYLMALLTLPAQHWKGFGMLLLVLTHLMLFVPLRNTTKAWLIAVPFAAAALDEGAGWLVRFVDPAFATLKVFGFVALQTSLAVLIFVSLWAVFTGSPRYYADDLMDEADEEAQ